MQHTISKHFNFPGDVPPIWKMPHQRDPLFLGREQLLQDLHTTLATEHHVLLFEPASEREADTSGAIETAVEYAYRYRSDYRVIAWIQADSREALRSDLLSLATALHLPQANLPDQDPLTAVVQWLRTHQHWLLVLDHIQEQEVLAPLMPLPEQGHLLIVTSTRSLESLAPSLELSQVPLEERTMLTQLSQVVGAALQAPQGRIPLGLEPITIGRASTNQVIISDPSVSSHHASIELKDQAYWITDRGSTNGTFLNQQRLVPQVTFQLHPGDTIRFGKITCSYEVLDRPSRSPVSSLSSEQGNLSAGTYPPAFSMIETPHQDRVGQRFGNYRLSQLLGQGGFAEVYLGEHIFLDTQVAIKVLHTQLVGQDVEQFRQEARTIAHLEHPHIVRILDFGVEGTIPYLIMSYAPNGTMRQRYPKGTRLSLELIISYVKQIAKALQYAHDHKVIHRDIKPENILFGSDDEVVLSDFGIALVSQSSRYQQPNDMAGTIAYMAPEQIEAHPRPASDQYSLGIVIYEWLCGERPFHGSFTEIAAKQQLVAPPSLQEKVPSLSGEVEQVVMTALAKDPKARFDSIRAFATSLEQASQQAKMPEPPAEHSSPVLDPLLGQDPVSVQSPAEQANKGDLVIAEQASSSVLSGSPSGVEEEPAVTQKVDEPMTIPTIPPEVSIPSRLEPAPSRVPPPASIGSRQGLPRRHLSWRTAALLIILALLILGSAGGLYAIVSNSTSTTQANAQATVQANYATATATVKVQATAGVIRTATSGQPKYSDPLTAGNVHDTTWTNDGTNCFFASDGYHVHADPSSPSANHPFCTESDRAYQDSAITIEMIINYGFSCGLLFRLYNNQGYFFDVGKGGNYSIYTWGTPKILQDWTNSNPIAINGGYQLNTLEVIAHGSDLLFYINGVYMTQVQDATYGMGNIGFACEANNTTGPGEAVFSNLKVYSSS
jgi:serine/threonine protein kinase